MTSLIGTLPNQVPTNADLGSMAYQDTEAVRLISLTVDGTLVMTNSNLLLGYSIDNGVDRLQVNGNISTSGVLNIGTSTPGASVRNNKNLTGSVNSWGYLADGVIQSDVTSYAKIFASNPRTAASTFSLSNLQHFSADQQALGAGSSIIDQRGFFVTSNLIGATNNYGFFGDIPSGTGRWNLYMNGSAANYLAGSLGIGDSLLTGFNLKVGKNITGAVSSFNISSRSTIQSDVTSAAYMFNTLASTQAAGFTLSALHHYNANQGSFGAGSTVSNQYGFIADSSLIGAISNFGFFGNIPSGTNRWNFYANGTAINYMNGALLLGTTTDNGVDKLQVNGSVRIIGNLGVGSTAAAGNSLYVNKTITGSTFSVGVSCNSQVQSDVTSRADYFLSAASVAAGTYPAVNHFRAQQASFTGTVTVQKGFEVDSSLVGATNNYGFYGNMPSGSGRYNLYMNGTADNYIAGNLGIGTVGLAGINLSVGANITGATTSFGIRSRGSVQSDVTAAAYGYSTFIGTAATTFTLPNLTHYGAFQNSLGSGSIVSSQYGFWADGSLVGASNNYGFYGNINSGTGRWNFYANGTATNYMNGTLLIGSTSDNGVDKLQVTGSATFTGNLNIGSSTTGASVRNNKWMTGGINTWAFLADGVIQSDSTNSARMFATNATTAANAFTLANLHHFRAEQQTLGVGSSITNQVGFFVTNTLTGASYNYGFFGDIPAGTNRYNLYMSGTADNYINGRVGIGSGPSSDTVLTISKSITGATVGYGVALTSIIQSDVTSDARYVSTYSQTAVGSYTVGSIKHYSANQGTIGAGSTVTNQYGFHVASGLTGATNNYAFFGGIASATGNYNLYMAGTADNYLAGVLQLPGVLRRGQGTTSSVTIGGASNQGIQNLGSGESRIVSGRYSNDINGAAIYLAKSRNTVPGSFTAITTGDQVGVISAYADDGTNLNNQVGSIVISTEGTIGAGATPGKIEFATTSPGSSSSTVRLTINSNGEIGIGAGALTGKSVYVAKNITGLSTSYGIQLNSTIQSDVTGEVFGISSTLSTASSSFTISDIEYFTASQGVIGAGSTVNNQRGFYVASSLTGATNNYGFVSNLAAGTGRWNMYMVGSALNYLNGSLLIGTTTDNGTDKLQVNGSVKTVGNLGVGSTAAAGNSLYVNKTITGSTFSVGVSCNSQVQSDVTSRADYFLSTASVAAGTYPAVNHFRAQQSTFTGTVTSQKGFEVDSSLTGATNNYGFYSNLASATGRYNLYMNGTADNYLAGSLGIGTTPSAGVTVRISKNVTGATSSYSVLNNPTVQSDVTSDVTGYRSTLSTQAAAFTITSLYNFAATGGTIGAGSTVTNQFGFHAESNLTGATNNYGFYGNIPFSTGRWNLYMNGTAVNYLNGALLVGTNSYNGTDKLQVVGSASISGNTSIGGFITQGLDTRYQTFKVILRTLTSSTSSTQLTTDGGAPTTSNTFGTSLYNNTVFMITGRIIGHQITGATAASYSVSAMVIRTSSAATLAFVGTPVITQEFATSGSGYVAPTITLDTANTTNGNLQINVTSPNTTDTKWMADLQIDILT